LREAALTSADLMRWLGWNPESVAPRLPPRLTGLGRGGAQGASERSTIGNAPMFFVLSKLLDLFAIPSNLVILVGIVGLLLLPTRFVRTGRWLAFASLVVLAILWPLAFR
jgi:hypothetical protein